MGDFDNDGLEDVLIYKWGYLQLFKNMGDLHFKDVTASAGLRQWMNANGAVWFDYDRDGLLDLYVAGYYRSDIDFWHLKTTRIMENSFEFATNGARTACFTISGVGASKMSPIRWGGQHPLDPGGRSGGLQRRRLARPVPGERLRPGGALPERPWPALSP